MNESNTLFSIGYYRNIYRKGWRVATAVQPSWSQRECFDIRPSICENDTHSMLPKRRFWKAERTFGNAFSKHFSKKSSPNRVLTSRLPLIPFFRQSPPLGRRFRQKRRPQNQFELFDEIVAPMGGLSKKRGWVADGWYSLIWKVLWKYVPECSIGLPKSSFGEHTFSY